MKKNTIPSSNRAVRLLGSNGFFWVIMLVFVLQAGWLALSGRYPMPFDEEFHLGIIKLYSQHVSPFWHSQPAGSEVFGIVSRDPSYLYQYLMSFPYRLIAAFTDTLRAEVVTLRFINIALFAFGIYLFRRLLVMAGGSRALVNSVLLIFILLPVVPLLAAQINYDNLIFPLVAISLILASTLTDRIIKTERFDLVLFVLLLFIGVFSSLVKFAYLPIFVAILIYLTLLLFKQFKTLKTALRAIKHSYIVSNKIALVSFTILLLLTTGLFLERYAVNTIKYHAPIPECTKVLTEQQCASYGPWLRDHDFAKAQTSRNYNVIQFDGEWFYGMWFRTFFALGGPLTTYETHGPLPVPSIAAIVFVVAGVAATIVQRRNLLKFYNASLLKMMGVVTFIYIVALWLEEFRAFSKTGQPVAINGRYLVLVYPIIIFVVAAAVSLQLKNKLNLRIATLAAAFVCLAYGGGTMTYVLRASPGWYWTSSSYQSINLTLQRNVGPWVIGYNNPKLWLR